MRRIQHAVADFADGGGGQEPGNSGVSTSWKGQGNLFSWEPPGKKNTALPTTGYELKKSHIRFLTYRTVR